MIDDFILSENQFLTCTGYEVMQNESCEEPLDLRKSIFEQRNFWFKYVIYDKSVIVKSSFNWGLGFHCILNKEKKYQDGLYLVHLHRFDWDLMLKRHLEAFSWKTQRDAGISFQYFLNKEDDLKMYFNEYIGIIEPIPTKITHALKNYGL
jgi:hypothetical protein